jgi:hypothetical protein
LTQDFIEDLKEQFNQEGCVFVIAFVPVAEKGQYMEVHDNLDRVIPDDSEMETCSIESFLRDLRESFVDEGRL